MAFVVGCALTLLGLISWISLCVKHGRGVPLYGPATAALGFGAGWLYAAGQTDPSPDEPAQGAPMAVFPPLPGFVAIGAGAVLTALAVMISVRRGRRMLISSDAPVLDGQPTKIWYDAADPGNERKIVVELATTSAR
ncbi:MAG: hypothetical protein AAGC80_14235 [Rhodococcus sp. (in: high G+C Gram-positive bacteria)]